MKIRHRGRDGDKGFASRGATTAGAPVAPWVNGPPGGSSLETRAAALFRRAPAPPAFGPQAHMRVRARLAAAMADAKTVSMTSTPSKSERRGLRGRALQWGLAAALLLGSGVVIAARGRGRDRWWTSWPASSRFVPTVEASRPSFRARGQAAVARVTVAETPDPPAAPPSDAQPKGVRATAVAPPLAQACLRREGGASGVESDLAVETRLLNGALIRLRQERDAAGALSELGQYLRRFPGGVLVAEANAARADALLILNREPEALAALDGMTLEGSGREQELRMIRGELRAASDCARAISDFDQILSATPSADLAERALYGRAVCRARQGREIESRSDAQRYLERFPSGRFTREARRLRMGGLVETTEIEP